MKTATENLIRDHVYIIKLTEIMQSISENKTGDIEDLKLIVSLVQNFADGLHHAKEENLLFPAMFEKGFSPENGPVAVMLHEHVQGREFIQNVKAGIEKFENGDKNASEQIYSNMLGYASLLQNHINKENNILFKMADQVFEEEIQTNLLNEFNQIEENYNTEYKVDNAVAKISFLADKYL